MEETMFSSYVALIKKETYFKLVEEKEGPLKFQDSYINSIDEDYCVCELTDTSKKPLNIADVYLLTGAIAMHEEYTTGVFVDKSDIEEVNDLYGWKGGGKCLCAHLLSSEERRDIIIRTVLAEKPGTDVKYIYIKSELPKNENEPWTPLREGYEELFSGNRHSFAFDSGKPRDVNYALETYTKDNTVYIFDLNEEMSKNEPIEDKSDILLIDYKPKDELPVVIEDDEVKISIPVNMGLNSFKRRLSNSWDKFGGRRRV